MSLLGLGEFICSDCKFKRRNQRPRQIVCDSCCIGTHEKALRRAGYKGEQLKIEIEAFCRALKQQARNHSEKHLDIPSGG